VVTSYGEMNAPAIRVAVDGENSIQPVHGELLIRHPNGPRFCTQFPPIRQRKLGTLWEGSAADLPI
jgi:hypothetical protein